jgi:hypothetical protein
MYVCLRDDIRRSAFDVVSLEVLFPAVSLTLQADFVTKSGEDLEA